MRSYRKKQILTLTLILVAIFGISIGFSAFSSTLRITPQVNVTPDSADFSVKFSTTQDSLTIGEVEPYSMTDGVTATNAIIDNSGIPTIKNMSAVYTGPGDYVTYRFYVRNDGEYIAYLDNITYNGGNICSEKKGTTASSANDACNDIIMTVKVGEVSVTETTLNILDETLNPGESKIVEVTVQYSENGYIPDGDFSLEFGTVSLYYTSAPTSGDIIIPPGTTPDETLTLPSEYQQVEYIQSTGTQYIDTGISYSASKNYKVETKGTLNSSIYSGSGWNAGGWFGVENSNNWTDGSSHTQLLANNLTDIVLEINQTTKQTTSKFTQGTITETLVRSNTSMSTYALVNYPIFSLTRNNASEELPYSGYIGKIYYLKFYSDNILIRHFIPCYRKSDNVIGMYDLVNGVFYTNSGTGTFIKGADV